MLVFELLQRSRQVRLRDERISFRDVRLLRRLGFFCQGCLDRQDVRLFAKNVPRWEDAVWVQGMLRERIVRSVDGTVRLLRFLGRTQLPKEVVSEPVLGTRRVCYSTQHNDAAVRVRRQLFPSRL